MHSDSKKRRSFLALFFAVGDVRREVNCAMYTIGSTYTRKDIYEILGLPENERGGDWLNGQGEIVNILLKIKNSFLPTKQILIGL